MHRVHNAQSPNVFITDLNNERKSSMYLFWSGWTCKLRGHTWSHGSWMVETYPMSPPWPLPPKWAGPRTFQLQLEIRASRCHYVLRRYTNYMSFFNRLPASVEEHKSRLILKFKTHNRNIAKSSVCLCFSKSLLCELRIKALTNKSGQPSDKDKSGWYVEPSVLEDTQNLVYGPYLAIPQFHSRSALASYSRTGPYTAHLLASIFFPVTIK